MLLQKSSCRIGNPLRDTRAFAEFEGSSICASLFPPVVALEKMSSNRRPLPPPHLSSRAAAVPVQQPRNHPPAPPPRYPQLSPEHIQLTEIRSPQIPDPSNKPPPQTEVVVESLPAQVAGSVPVNNDTCAVTVEPVADASPSDTTNINLEKQRAKDNEKIERNVSAWALDHSYTYINII